MCVLASSSHRVFGAEGKRPGNQEEVQAGLAGNKCRDWRWNWREEWMPGNHHSLSPCPPSHLLAVCRDISMRRRMWREKVLIVLSRCVFACERVFALRSIICQTSKIPAAAVVPAGDACTHQRTMEEREENACLCEFLSLYVWLYLSYTHTVVGDRWISRLTS